MKCRITINGKKIWLDNGVATRPQTLDIQLLRDGELIDTITLDTAGDGVFRFPCLPVWKDGRQKYIYTVDEATVPAGYTKKIEGFTITNALENIEISGVKVWMDNDDVAGDRPASVIIHLAQNGVRIRNTEVTSPQPPENQVPFSFADVPFADQNGVPYVYTVEEDDLLNYTTTISGFTVTNSHSIQP